MGCGSNEIVDLARHNRRRARRQEPHPRVPHAPPAPPPSHPPIVERASESITVIGESVSADLHVVWTELNRRAAPA